MKEKSVGAGAPHQPPGGDKQDEPADDLAAPERFPVGSNDERKSPSEVLAVGSQQIGKSPPRPVLTIAEFPRTAAFLRETGLSDEQIAVQLQLLDLEGLTGITDDELFDILENGAIEGEAPDVDDTSQIAPATKAQLWRFLTMRWHAGVRWYHHRSLLSRLIYGAAWIWVLVEPILRKGFSWRVVPAIAVIVLMRSQKAVSELDPTHMQQFKRTYTERKLLFQKVLHTQQLWLDEKPTPRELVATQTEALELITLFVRDHRADLSGKKVFVNLIRQVGGEVEVIRRCSEDRPVPQRYKSTECTLAWACLTTGKPQVTGSVHELIPNTATGKPYNSILVLPVKLNGQVLGCVSIDSEMKYHFDDYVEELAVQLAPYVQLLAVTLSNHYARYPDPAILPVGG